MSRTIQRLLSLTAAAYGALLFAGSAQAHECRALGQAQNEELYLKPQYWLCVGFAVEDGDRPRAGTRNNLDFIPIFVPGNPHAPQATRHQLPDEPLDTRRGDRVDFKATLVHLKGDFYEIEHDADFKPLDDWGLLKHTGVGYSSPLANTRYARTFNWFRPVELDEDGEISITYRVPFDFITPYAGLYAWIVEGTIQRKGREAVRFTEKFVSAQPRIPYGPTVVHATSVDLTTLQGAPEGWFDAVRPADGGAHPHAARASSPRASAILKRRYGGK